MISTEVFGSSDDVGSSASSSFGCCITRARDAHALALAAGQRVGAPVAKPARPTASAGRRRASISARAGTCAATPSSADVAEPARQQVFHHRQALDQVVFLEHHADVRGARWRSRAPGSVARSVPSNRISPAVGSTSRLMQRISVRLAGARRPDDRRDARARRSSRSMSVQHRLAALVLLDRAASMTQRGSWSILRGTSRRLARAAYFFASPLPPAPFPSRTRPG